MKGKRRRETQRKGLDNNRKYWTGMNFASSTWATGDMNSRKGIIVKSSVVP